MKEYEFELTFELPDATENPDVYLEDLYEAGCNDALIGLGSNGRIAFIFTRKSESPLDAIVSAVRDVHKVIHNAKLIQIFDY